MDELRCGIDRILDEGLEVWDGRTVGSRIGGAGWMEYWMEDWRCGKDGILDGELEV